MARAMTVILERARFLHVPKTGGTWVRQALAAGCPAAQTFYLDGSGHTRWFETPGADKFTFAFVRHPLAWWRSFWRFHQGPARRYVVSHRICRECWSDDFDEFVANVVRTSPGDYGRLIEFYLGPVGACVDFVGRQERLLDDLLRALAMAGEPHDAECIRAVAMANVSDAGRPAEYGPATRAAMLAAEAPMMRRFGYDGDAEDPAVHGRGRAVRRPVGAAP